MSKILIVEDDLEIQGLIEYFLINEGYEVLKTSDGLEGLKLLKIYKPNLVILDLMLPSLDGKNFAKIVREKNSTYGDPYIIMLTAKTDIDDVLSGLEVGANDYIRKPFDPRELVARVKNLLKDKSLNSNKKIYKVENISIDDAKHQVLCDDEEISLSKKEYDLLVLFIINKGLVITREEILDKIWDSNYYSGDRTVDVYISKLRDKLPSISKNIKTIKGVGYKLEERKQ